MQQQHRKQQILNTENKLIAATVFKFISPFIKWGLQLQVNRFGAFLVIVKCAHIVLSLCFNSHVEAFCTDNVRRKKNRKTEHKECNE